MKYYFKTTYVIIAILGSQFFLSCQTTSTEKKKAPFFDDIKSSISLIDTFKPVLRKKVSIITYQNDSTATDTLSSKVRLFDCTHYPFKENELMVFEEFDITDSSTLVLFEEQLKNDPNEKLWLKKADANHPVRMFHYIQYQNMPAGFRGHLIKDNNIYKTEKKVELDFTLYNQKMVPNTYKVFSTQKMLGKSKKAYLIEGKFIYK